MPKRLARVIDYKRVFSTAPGKRVLADLMQEGHLLAPTMTDSNNPNIIYFNEGKRNIVLFIMSILKLDVEKLRQQIDEESKNDNIEY